ncbi:MAG: hypothetical protein COU08_02280 [Candidatus Harrisonbacteria bacterium CG10_big_fil_rev_8_21_14_0_10_42_17]|uniref:Major facilitator superfamily (MFS) profile domain-containing protein n=1 Tax=Candidatus Harrisonbacteria bacterium CG10_big_fil_rev_8_21_14_0_10_42_17 TaxID=1974584 RepID=A0A2M6WI47_9BACT|nr:MAG: hypothetical protein COU08_02280 [Candidatus Harrisonbacteria bacterium CG10_big_fil_rev_8_21_14_0_10_42_17]
MRIHIDISVKVSRIVKIFVFADFLLLAGWGLIVPIFSIFLIERIVGATLTTIGIATSVYWLSKSILQLPIANFIDKTKNERVSFYFSFLGLLLGSLVAFLFIFITQTWQLYVLEFLHALAFGMYVPSWRGIFSKHLDKDHIALDWSLDSTAIGFAAGVSGFIGGVLADSFGFEMVFILAAVFSLGSSLVMLFAPRFVFPPHLEPRTRIQIH